VDFRIKYTIKIHTHTHTKSYISGVQALLNTKNKSLIIAEIK